MLIGFYSGQQFSFFVDLDVGVLIVRYYLLGEEFVIVRVKVIFVKLEVISEIMKEIGIFEDNSMVGSCLIRKIRDIIVNVCRGGNFNVLNG